MGIQINADGFGEVSESKKEVFGLPRVPLAKLEKYQSIELESTVRKYWEANDIPKWMAGHEQDSRKRFFLLDGPPYANALPHVGHVKTTTCKDVWSKFKAMQGYSVYLQPGFDCHGLPVEVMVQKENNILSNADIERMGLAKFDSLCLSKVTNTEHFWMETYRMLGAWRGYFDPYFTYSKSYIESAWWTLKRQHEQGLLVRKSYPTHWCPTCETVLSGYEVSDSYKEVTDPSLYVKFKVHGTANEYLLVWTTTPWTLPSNVAVFVNPAATYVKAKVTTNEGKEEVYILAKERLKPVLEELAELSYTVLEEFPGSALDGVKYEPLLDTETQREIANTTAHRVYLSVPLLKVKRYKKHKFSEEGKAPEEKEAESSGTQTKRVEKQEVTLPADEGEDFEEFVTLTDGTGLVHCAPGHGQSDHKMGLHYKLPAPSPLDKQGKFTAGVSRWQGRFVKSADKDIIAALEAEGKLLLATKVRHKYPLCWRCKTPLVYRLTEQWYLSIESIKEKMLSSNEHIKWMPPSGREFFGNWMEASTDWCISRQRYWAIPLPIWLCTKCEAFEVLGSLAELRSRAKSDPGDLQDLHRSSVDNIVLKCSVCGADSKRVPDVFDVWYDAGTAPWASLGYPQQNKELFEKMFPVSLVNESQDQIRGWFYYLMFSAMATFGKPPYQGVAMMGWLVDAKGEKMSKSQGNVVWGREALEKMGADALRLYYCSEAAPWDVQKFNFLIAEEVRRSLNILWNSYLFFDTYKPTGYKPQPVTVERAAKLAPLDRWLLSRANTVTEQVTKLMEDFEFHKAGRILLNFVTDDLSRWYIRLSRDRLSPANANKGDLQDCADVLRSGLLQATKLLAPITPFLSEYLYQVLDGAEPTVIAVKYPTPQMEFMDERLERAMAVALAVVEGANSARADAKLKLRWPVRSVAVSGPAELKEAVDMLQPVMREACNALSIDYAANAPAGDWPSKPFVAGSLSGTVSVNPARDQELLFEAFYRELVRAVQAARKQAGLDVRKDSISLYVLPSDDNVRSLLSARTESFASDVGAKKVVFVGSASDLKEGVPIEPVQLDAFGVKAVFARV